MKKEVIKKDGKTNKCCNVLICLIAGLLIISAALNVWLVYEKTVNFPPENKGEEMTCRLINSIIIPDDTDGSAHKTKCEEREFCKWLEGKGCVAKNPNVVPRNPTKMMCTLINDIEDANLREPACNSHSDVCKWENNKCMPK